MGPNTQLALAEGFLVNPLPPLFDFPHPYSISVSARTLDGVGGSSFGANTSG